MNPLAETTRNLRSRNRKALVAFLTAGYPDDATFAETVRAAADAGADVIEIGIPFSDPIADGPVIQAASAAALARDVTIRRALALASELEVAVPRVAMGYVNPVLTMGVDAFARAAAAAGLCGVILADVSFEESGAFRGPLREAGLAYVDLVAPTTGEERMRSIGATAEGFLYLVTMTGVTGARRPGAAEVAGLAARARAATDAPVYAGFGIAAPEQARDLAAHVDGVIIGSRLLEIAAEGSPGGVAGRSAAFLAQVRAALDRREV